MSGGHGWKPTTAILEKLQWRVEIEARHQNHNSRGGQQY